MCKIVDRFVLFPWILPYLSLNTSEKEKIVKVAQTRHIIREVESNIRWKQILHKIELNILYKLIFTSAIQLIARFEIRIHRRFQVLWFFFFFFIIIF